MWPVQCPACRHENRASAKFCDECGAPLPRALSGAAARRARRAPSSATSAASSLTARAAAPRHPRRARAAEPATRRTRGPRPRQLHARHLAEKILVSRSALEGERKQVTVLFADCVGLHRAVEPARPRGPARRSWTAASQRVMDAVHRYEGTVNQFTGDGVMALFGAPIAHEDHAVRAVAAALGHPEGHARVRRDACGASAGSTSRCASGSTPGPSWWAGSATTCAWTTRRRARP